MFCLLNRYLYNNLLSYQRKIKKIQLKRGLFFNIIKPCLLNTVPIFAKTDKIWPNANIQMSDPSNSDGFAVPNVCSTQKVDWFARIHNKCLFSMKGWIDVWLSSLMRTKLSIIVRFVCQTFINTTWDLD